MPDLDRAEKGRCVDPAVTLSIEQLESQGSVEPVTIKLPTELVRRRSV